MAIWNRLTAFVTGGAVATAAADAMAPEFEVLKQTAWSNEPHKVLDAATAARVRARETDTDLPGINTQGVNLQDDAARTGTGSNRFDLLTELARTMPGVAQLIDLRRRNQANPKSGITDPEMTAALRHQGYTADHIAAIKDLVSEPLNPEQIAAAIHRGLIPDPSGLLKGEQPKPPFSVEAYPVYAIDGQAEAAKHGFDLNELGVLVGLQGLPMGVIEAAQAYYRGIITYGDYIRAFNESNNRNEWATSVLEYARQIPTARDFFENALRGYHDLAWAQDQAKRHGMSDADSLVIYQNQGRPMNIHAAQQALARGAKFNPEPGELRDPFDAIVVEGNLKPAYYEMAKALRYTLPSVFTMRNLAETGVWSEAKTAERLKWAGWYPEDADEAAKAWAGGTTATVDPWVKRAQTQFWTATHNSFRDGLTADAEARDNLAALGLGTAAINDVMQLWTYERDTWRKQITPTQIMAAYNLAQVNPATGLPWTEQNVIDAMIARGYNYNDAKTFFDEKKKT